MISSMMTTCVVLRFFATVMTFMVAVAVPIGATTVAQEDNCFDFSEYLPDNITVDGCWTCDRDVHWWESLKALKWKVTFHCTSDDGSTLTVGIS